jgi:hypothetical protein
MNTNIAVKHEKESIPKSQRSKLDTSGSIMIPNNLSRVYYVGHNGTQIREAVTKDTNTHVDRRELGAISRLQLCWEDDPSLIRLHTTAAEQRNRDIRWDIADHCVYRELQGTVLEMVLNAADLSEENTAAGQKGNH